MISPALVCWLVLTAHTVMVASQPATVCPVDPRLCSCATDIIDCSGRGLKTLPNFGLTSVKYRELRLDNNLLENITDRAFTSLSGLAELALYNNKISLITQDAFYGLEPTLTRLDLRNNHLDILPSAIGTLAVIETLDVAYNDIKAAGFIENTMRYIGDTITRFDFGSNIIEEWPSTLRHLQALQYLNVTGGSFYTLPPDAFHGFEGTLTTLGVQDTSLIAIPLALSRLRYLDRLYLDHNHDIRDSGILIPSFGGNSLLHNLRYISLRDDNLTVFPHLLHLLHNVETLVLDSNRLAFVSDTSVQVAIGTKITNLSLKNCSLTRVPGAMSKLTNLTSLDLSNNNIHSFENSDFANMVHLKNLTISHNPVEYIANDCFRDLNSLTELNLKDTQLHSMPRAIASLKSLAHLSVPQKRMECTCNIVWLKRFIDKCNSAIVIEGSCETIDFGIQEYLSTLIPTCPNFLTFDDSTIHC